MKWLKVNNIVIVGGGISGWLTALSLRKLSHLNVTLIESDKIPHIGVGESTQPQLSRFLYNIGYQPTDWMPHANATYKLGVMFNGWSDNQFIIDAGSKLWSSLDTTEYDSYSMHDAAIATGMTAKEWSDWFPPYRMAINNKSPKFGKERFNYLEGREHPAGTAVQWDNIANGEDDEYCGTEQDCTRETFQLILRDPSIYQTETGDGEIIFQYKDIQDIDENGNYSTIGIESPDQNFGYQYQFRNITYGTQLVENEMAILFTTNSNETFLSIDESILPSQLSLFQNFPNPFNPTTTISFNLDYSVVVNMSIFDLNGTIVYQVINNQFYPAGKHSININAGELPSGLYFYQLQSGNDIQTKKMLLLK